MWRAMSMNQNRIHQNWERERESRKQFNFSFKSFEMPLELWKWSASFWSQMRLHQIFPQRNRAKAQEGGRESKCFVFRRLCNGSASNASLICSVIYDNVHFYAPQCVDVFTHQAAENELSIRQREDNSIFPKKWEKNWEIRVNVHVAQTIKPI